MSSKIEIVGASTNNLQSIDVDLPLHQATLVIGVSGSGKSSLLADTLAAESNTRMHRFLDVSQPHLPDDDVPAFIGPVPASIHFSQGAFRASRRTTVATSSGLMAQLRFYFRKYAKPWAEELEEFVPPPSAQSYAEWIEKNYSGPISVWTVVERWERTDGMHAAGLLRRHGILHAIIRSETDSLAQSRNGREVNLERFRPLSAKSKHLIEAEVGKTFVNSDANELLPLLERAFKIGGDVIVELRQGKDLPQDLHSERGILLDSTQHWIHPKVLLPFAPATDSLLSFNSPSNPRGGACPTCQGLGRMRSINLDLLVTRPKLSLHGGALSLWTEKNYRYVNIQHSTIEGLHGLRGFAPDIPWKNLDEKARELILFGSGKESIADVDVRTGRKVNSPRPFPGFVPTILRRIEGTGASARALEALTVDGPCPDCEGTRWSRSARALRLDSWDLPFLLGLTFDEMSKMARPKGELERGLTDASLGLASNLWALSKAFVLTGLGHLAGDRGMTTLSEGESRRSRLAALLRARGQGLALLLDEPARGLHEEDVTRLAEAFSELKSRHTLIINEHRLSVAAIADHVLEVGPGAGTHGGRIINSGPPSEVFTSDWYPNIERSKIPVSKNTPYLTVKGASLHTLSNITCEIPLGHMVCITGVSGSGKSSFIRGILLPALAQALPQCVESDGFSWPDGVWESIIGTVNIDSVLALEPRVSGVQRRSTVVTLLDMADDLRRIFGKSDQAREAGLTATDFGLNAGRGRCQTCLGLGEIEDGNGWVLCPHCGGRRFGEEALGIRVEGLNVTDLLEISIVELLEHSFADLAGWRPLLEQLVALDLGYLALGRRIDRLSGGEHQRLRLARTLGEKRPDGLLLILDEPSAGLHPRDVAKLLDVLDHVVGKGRNTVVLVEHNLDLIRASDWVIDFGPGGGPAGGQIIGKGPPDIVGKEKTPTGRALRNKRLQFVAGKGEAAHEHDVTDPIVSAAGGRNGRHWLKHLLGAEVSKDDPEPIDFEGLAVTFDPTPTVRAYEIGGLDIEIARLLFGEPDEVGRQSDRMAELWLKTPGAQLKIHPLIEELRVWGEKVPSSIIRETRERLKHMGLESDFVVSAHGKTADVRVTGKRFQEVGESIGDRLRCIRDALGIGGGFVELQGEKQGVIATVLKRRLALKIPAVAPLSPSSACMVRSHSAGRCPGCVGSGTVPVFDKAFVVGNSNVDPTSEQFLHSEALQIFKGTRRSIFLPFFKRMISEGLWPAGKAYSQLTPEENTTLMHGYWHRPGPGSFLKTSKSDPEEVNSWLRWNGLFRAILNEIDRSKSSAWKSGIHATTHLVECPICTGTGLQRHTKAIFLGAQSVFDWVRCGTIGEMMTALEKLTLTTKRSDRTRKRILHCLEPLNRSIPKAPLREPIEDIKLHRAVFERTVHSMTRLGVLG
jgi:excinuclease ABC A subunit